MSGFSGLGSIDAEVLLEAKGGGTTMLEETNISSATTSSTATILILNLKETPTKVMPSGSNIPPNRNPGNGQRKQWSR